MKVIHSKKVKYILLSLVILAFFFTIKPSNIYGFSVSYYQNIEVYSTNYFYVSGSGNWIVYTLKTGRYANKTFKDSKWKDIVEVRKVTEGGITKIKVEALNAGTVRIYVKDLNNWVEKCFDVNVTKRDITYASINLSQTSYTYNNVEKLPKVTSVKLNGYNIYDYYVQYKNNVKAGTATVYVVGRGNNTGTAWQQFEIKPRNISNGRIELYSDTYTYTGGEITPNIKSVTINNGAVDIYDYKVSYYNNVKAGTGKIVVTGTGSNTGSITKYFTIKKRDISKGHIEFENDVVTYNNRPQTPKFRVWLDRAEIFDYSIQYENNNVKPGIVTVKVTGTGSNTGTLKKSFVIQRRDISNAKIKLEYDYTTYDGTEKEPEVKSVILGDNTEIYDYEVSYSLNKKRGIAKVFVTGKGGNTGTAKTTFRILDPSEAMKDEAKKLVNKLGNHKLEYGYSRYSENGFSSNCYVCCTFVSEVVYNVTNQRYNFANYNCVDVQGIQFYNSDAFELIYYHPGVTGSSPDFSEAVNTDKKINDLLKPGDIVATYSNENTFQHIMIYIGGGEYANMADSENDVCIQPRGFDINCKYIFRLK